METGLYYLQSRYYDPEMGRFINADAYASTGQGLLGNNMFAYCSNNPVMGFDPHGEFDLLGAAAGFAEGFVVKKPFAVTRKYLWTDIYKIDVGTVSVNKKHFRVIRVFFTQPSNSLDKWVRQIGTYLSKPNSIQLISHTDAGFNEIMNYYQN